MITVILSTISISIYLLHFIGIGLYLRFKPFNCEKCLPIWIAAIILFLPKEVQEIILELTASANLTAIAFQWLRN